MKKLKIIFLLLSFFMSYELAAFGRQSYAQDNNALVALSKRIIEAKDSDELLVYFEELKGLYFKENKYSEFTEFLKSLSQQKESLSPFVNYYTALARYSQLKYLEDTKGWDEYFSDGGRYRDEIALSLQQTINSTGAKDALNIYSRLLLWQYHKYQQDALADPSLSALVDAVKAYAAGAADNKPIKDAADRLLEYSERGKSSQLYRLYVGKLIGSAKSDKDLEDIAAGFYKAGNLELAEAVYDAYIERIAKSYTKEQLIPVLINIAKDFSYKDEGQKDAPYAEEIFRKIEEIGTKSVFGEDLSYLRALNAEKMKDYPKAKDLYLDLLQRYPQTKYGDEAAFKSGIIYTYILRDAKTGKEYFERLASKETLSPHGISSLYQLGLLVQWENDLVKAKDYYNKLIEKAASDYTQISGLAQERLKEINESKPLEYNLKSFLDASLKPENSSLEAAKIDLVSSKASIKKDDTININCSPYSVQSGCMQVEVQYLWSGDLGNAKPALSESNLKITFTERGTKIINLVLVSSSGILERTIEIVDVD